MSGGRSLTKRHPRRHSALVQPEGNPRDNHQHAARDVDLNEVVTELPLEKQIHFQATVFT